VDARGNIIVSLAAGRAAADLAKSRVTV